MRIELEDILELLELDKQQSEIIRRRNIILKRLEQRAKYSSPEQKKTLPTKTAAIEDILREAGSPQYIKKIAADLVEYGFVSSERTISGMLRGYARQNKVFTAEGGNKFGLLDWSKKNS
jgi:hypothetical protein